MRCVLKAHAHNLKWEPLASRTQQERLSTWLCVCCVGGCVSGCRCSPSRSFGWLAELGQLILQGCACWSDYARWQNPTVLRSLLGDAATLRVESPHGQSGRRVDRQSEFFG